MRGFPWGCRCARGSSPDDKVMKTTHLPEAAEAKNPRLVATHPQTVAVTRVFSAQSGAVRKCPDRNRQLVPMSAFEWKKGRDAPKGGGIVPMDKASEHSAMRHRLDGDAGSGGQGRSRMNSDGWLHTLLSYFENSIAWSANGPISEGRSLLCSRTQRQGRAEVLPRHRPKKGWIWCVARL